MKNTALVLIGLSVNAILWIIYGIWATRHAYPIGVIVMAYALIATLIISSIGIVITHLISIKLKLNKWLHLLSFAIPSVLIVLFSLSTASETPENKRQGIVSPSGDYVLYIPIIDDQWAVTIQTSEGQAIYQDTDSGLPGWFNAYWGWDEENRIWLYNSDDGHIYFWEQQDSEWIKTWWDRNNPSTPTPPLHALPEYARHRIPS